MNKKLKTLASVLLIGGVLTTNGTNIHANMQMNDYQDTEVSKDYWTKEIVIDPIVYPEALNKSKTFTSIDHDRYDLGIQLLPGAEIEVMQTNPKYDCPSKIKLWNNNSGDGDDKTRMPEAVIRGPENNKWFKLTANQLSVPFIQTLNLLAAQNVKRHVLK